MIQAYSKREIRSAFYELKREWGCAVEYHKLNRNDVDLTTGTTEMEYDKFQIRRAILLPSEIIRQLTLIGKPFNYGGESDENTRWLLVERKDLPVDFTICLDDYWLIDDVTYSFVKPIKDYNFDTVLIFKITVTLPEKVEE
jgi:hypothetical protein